MINKLSIEGKYSRYVWYLAQDIALSCVQTQRQFAAWNGLGPMTLPGLHGVDGAIEMKVFSAS